MRSIRTGRAALFCALLPLALLLASSPARAQAPCDALWRVFEVGRLGWAIGPENEFDAILAEGEPSECAEALERSLGWGDFWRIDFALVAPLPRDAPDEDFLGAQVLAVGGAQSVLAIERGENGREVLVGYPAGTYGLSEQVIRARHPAAEIAFLRDTEIGTVYAVAPPGPQSFPAVVAMQPSGGSLADLDPDDMVSASVDPSELRELRASRSFGPLSEQDAEDFAGMGLVAFLRDPSGELAERARILCGGFLLGMDSIEVELSGETALEKQVATIWPMQDAERAQAARDAAETDAAGACAQAVSDYDWREGSDALMQAADFFEARGKGEIAERLRDGDQDGPWLLAWNPGANRGSTEDDVLVLAFDLSFVETPLQAERVFQSWRVTIERNPDLWFERKIANESWSTAIIRWANLLGRELNFYERMIQ